MTAKKKTTKKTTTQSNSSRPNFPPVIKLVGEDKDGKFTIRPIGLTK